MGDILDLNGSASLGGETSVKAGFSCSFKMVISCSGLFGSSIISLFDTSSAATLGTFCRLVEVLPRYPRMRAFFGLRLGIGSALSEEVSLVRGCSLLLLDSMLILGSTSSDLTFEIDPLRDMVQLFWYTFLILLNCGNYDADSACFLS